MKPKSKILKILPFIFFISLGAILAFTFRGKTENSPSSRDLMASMQISRVSREIKAPDFMLKDLAEKTVRLNDYLGKIVLLNFWTTW